MKWALIAKPNWGLANGPVPFSTLAFPYADMLCGPIYRSWYVSEHYMDFLSLEPKGCLFFSFLVNKNHRKLITTILNHKPLEPVWGDSG